MSNVFIELYALLQYQNYGSTMYTAICKGLHLFYG
jgi:hypothetical protein